MFMKKLSAVAVLMWLVLSAVNAFSMGSMPPAPPVDLQNPPGECSAPKIPVVFVHGLYGSGAAWGPAINFLVNNGYDRSLLIANSMTVDNNSLCSSEHPKVVAQWIDAVLKAHPEFTQVDLVGHSRGGCNIMEGLWTGAIDYHKVRSVVTLSGANRACKTTFPPIPGDETPGEVNYSVYFSAADKNVSYNITRVDGAYEEDLGTLTHSDMRKDPLALAAMLDGLQASGCE